MGDGIRVTAIAIVLGGLAILYVFHPLSPALPRSGLDPSWIAVMGEAADRSARWGVETAFTYGPASPVVTGYYNDAWATRTVPLQAGFAALFGWCTALLVASRRTGRTALAGTVAMALMLVAARGNQDALLLCLPFLVFLLALQRGPGRAEAVAARIGAAALGLTAMIKMSFPLAALPLLAVADVVAIARRHFPVYLPLFSIGVLAGALLYGQRLSDLPAYAAMQGEVVTGFAAAMGLDGPDWDLYPFIVLAIALVGIATSARREPDRWPVGVGLAIALLFLFKAGFVRHDLHALTAWTGLTILGALVAWRSLGRRAALGVTVAVSLVAFVYEPVMTVRQSVRTGRGGVLLHLYAQIWEAPERESATAWNALRDPAGYRAGLDAAKAVAWSEIARGAPLGALPGTVDILPSRQAELMAAGLDYHGRPSFQEYSTYTPKLAAANDAFLDGPEAPRWILFGPESFEGSMGIDGRFPSLSEGPLWPDLLRLYRPDHRIGDLLALQRRAAPAPLAMGSARAATARFGDFTHVRDDSPVWATLDVQLDTAGRALSMLFRPPVLMLAVELDDGTERRFRLVPAMAAAGFLLSPLVDNATDYAALAAGRPAGAGRRVVGFAVEASAAAQWFYKPTVAATLRSMDVSALAAAAPPEALPQGRLAAPASGAISLPIGNLPIVGGERRVALSYGLDEGAERSVCFAVRPADGTGSTLWSACLDSAAAGGEAKPITLDVPEGVEELALQTRCVGACPAYWTIEGDRRPEAEPP